MNCNRCEDIHNAQSCGFTTRGCECSCHDNNSTYTYTGDNFSVTNTITTCSSDGCSTINLN